ncbi:hypothetical protein AGABI2DRAFT_121380 [Agaricus bisporus var. bisporus H97]|uniref:hypothetical protein n=1 Tax=Agaricus bisporus var. bisporus (strain H97 / ATCC MYA-4626 / FGSC 10389) TaxID=936046 RepID=UPI00029F7C27|nr:hypothetical protein AGABI2DRAFT_121380 [Agaricus bisporus var. bisporus H97]EKV44191.1 hypothetical protein AGABI2DRAFT_121380 [Agaricus bisporus var. bisporus H97]
MFDFGDRARAPQSSKARQWVEVRDWWSHSVLLTNACTNTPRVAKSIPQRAEVTPFLVGIDQPVRLSLNSPLSLYQRLNALCSKSRFRGGAVAGLAYGSCISSSLFFITPGVADWIYKGMTRRYASSRHYTRSSIKNNDIQEPSSPGDLSLMRLRIIASKSSERLSLLFLLLGSTSSEAGMWNIVGEDWFCFTLIFVLYMKFYPEHRKYVQLELEAPDDARTSLMRIKTYVKSSEWRTSLLCAWVTLGHFVFSAITTLYLMLTAVSAPAPDVPLRYQYNRRQCLWESVEYSYDVYAISWSCSYDSWHCVKTWYELDELVHVPRSWSYASYASCDVYRPEIQTTSTWG